jgi:hypothetical protein
MMIVSDGAGCYDTSANYVISAPGYVGTTTATDAISVYPNPSASTLYVVAPVPVSVTVMSVDGKVLIQQSYVDGISVGELANGVYLIKVYDTEHSLLYTGKFSKIN